MPQEAKAPCGRRLNKCRVLHTGMRRHHFPASGRGHFLLVLILLGCSVPEGTNRFSAIEWFYFDELSTVWPDAEACSSYMDGVGIYYPTTQEAFWEATGRCTEGLPGECPDRLARFSGARVYPGYTHDYPSGYIVIPFGALPVTVVHEIAHMVFACKSPTRDIDTRHTDPIWDVIDATPWERP